MSLPNSAISLHIVPTLLVSGCSVEGEVELNFRELQKDNIQEVHVKLKGVVVTDDYMSTNAVSGIRIVPLVRDEVSVWCQGGAYPPPGSDVLRIPFSFRLPPHLPPSFHYNHNYTRAAVRYALSAVGTRPGALQTNRRVRAPLAIVPKDTVGAAIREKLGLMTPAGSDPEWRTERKEERIRRGLFGNYSTVQVELKVPRISVFPLYVPIPFVIKIRTVSTPLSRAKAEAHPPTTPVFPQVPFAYSAVQFKLQRRVIVKGNTLNESLVPSEMVALFKPPPTNSGSILVEDVAPRIWVPLEGTNVSEKQDEQDASALGTWVQEATFRSTFCLGCPPTFSSDTLKCDYQLALKVPFPGVGNDVSLTMPITITSGIDAPTKPGQPEASSGPLDLPPSYWDADYGEWDNDN